MEIPKVRYGDVLSGEKGERKMIHSFKKNFFPQLPPGIFVREKTHKEGMGPCDFER